MKKNHDVTRAVDRVTYTALDKRAVWNGVSGAVYWDVYGAVSRAVSGAVYEAIPLDPPHPALKSFFDDVQAEKAL